MKQKIKMMRWRELFSKGSNELLKGMSYLEIIKYRKVMSILSGIRTVESVFMYCFMFWLVMRSLYDLQRGTLPYDILKKVPLSLYTLIYHTVIFYIGVLWFWYIVKRVVTGIRIQIGDVFRRLPMVPIASLVLMNIMIHEDYVFLFLILFAVLLDLSCRYMMKHILPIVESISLKRS